MSATAGDWEAIASWATTVGEGSTVGVAVGEGSTVGVAVGEGSAVGGMGVCVAVGAAVSIGVLEGGGTGVGWGDGDKQAVARINSRLQTRNRGY
jgi:hypothetical protein